MHIKLGAWACLQGRPVCVKHDAKIGGNLESLWKLGGEYASLTQREGRPCLLGTINKMQNRFYAAHTLVCFVSCEGL